MTITDNNTGKTTMNCKIEENDMDIVLDALDSLYEDMRWNNKNGGQVSPYSYNLKEVERLYYTFAKAGEEK